MGSESPVSAAYDILDRAIVHYNGQPVGALATMDPHLFAANYTECFVRDFVPCGLVFLSDGREEIVKNFLKALLEICSQQTVMEGHDRVTGLMPASFRITEENIISADFGDRAIGRVAPVDSLMWWMILLRCYVSTTGDSKLAHSPEFQNGIRLGLELYLKESFEASPSMLVPDGSFMIDRRMGVYGHPLEIQALFYSTLNIAKELLIPTSDNQSILVRIKKRLQTLRSYVRICYWLDLQRLNEIHRFTSEGFGEHATNVLNIYPESIPEWLDGWLPDKGGYFVGNLGPGRIDFRFFAFGNLLTILFGLATKGQADNIMDIYEEHREHLVGRVPVKICYPPVSGKEWEFTTGSDHKNVPWSYHNGGHWPCLLWTFVAAAIRTGRHNLAIKAFELVEYKLATDNWPEYYDGKTGSLIGRRAHLQQSWTAAAYILAHKQLKGSKKISFFDCLYV